MAGKRMEKPAHITALLERHGVWMTREGKSERTAELYGYHICTAARFAGGWDALLALKREDVSRLLEAWGSERKTPQEKRLHAMRSFFRFLIIDGVRGDNPMETPREPGRRVSREAYEQLRDTAITALLEGTELRPWELRELLLSGYTEPGQLILNDGRRISLSGQARQALEDFLALERGHPLYPESLLFSDVRGRRLQAKYLKKLARDTEEPGSEEELLRWFRMWLRAQGRLEKTAVVYTRVVRLMAEAAGGMDALCAASEEALLALRGRYPVRSVVWDSWSAMSAFFLFLNAAQLRAGNPPGGPAEQAADKGLPPVTPLSEFGRLRDQAITALLTGTDLRPGVLRTLPVGCYDRELGRLRLKGGRVTLNGAAAQAMDEYLVLPRGSVLEPRMPGPEEPLFVDTRGRRLSEEYFMGLIRRGLQLAELVRQQTASAG